MICSRTGDNPFSEPATNYYLNCWPHHWCHMIYISHSELRQRLSLGSWWVLFSHARFHQRLSWCIARYPPMFPPTQEIDWISSYILYGLMNHHSWRNRTVDIIVVVQLIRKCTRCCLESIFIDLFITTHTLQGTEVHSTNIWHRTFR